ncbi:hypothetical protein [Chryseobacterium taiwanense]|nr:hypothetical protein [Chryseobacterium taiwanense]
MKKINYIPLLTFILCSGSLFSQSGESYMSAPSAASVTSFVNAPVSLSTGIPDINIPFFSLSARSSSLGINIGISYHPNNSFKKNKATDVGSGWSLYGGSCLIYRETNPYNGIPTEAYYYNFMGRSGKFLLKPNDEGVKTVLPLTYDKLQITYTESSNSFKIIDPSGNEFLFDKADRAYSGSQSPPTYYTSAYYLSKVKDVQQADILTFDYIEDNYLLNPASLIRVKSLKLSKITSPDYGSIELTYNLDTDLRTKMSDPFWLQRVDLKNKAGKTIQKYTLQNDIGTYTYHDLSISSCGAESYDNSLYDKRILRSVRKYGTGDLFEQTSFEYNTSSFSQNYWSYLACNCLPNEDENPKYLGIGLLSTIQYPTGGKTRYEFEPNTYGMKKTNIYDPLEFDWSTNYIPPYTLGDRDAQILEDVGTFSFDSHNGYSGTFQLSANPDDAQGASYLMYCVNVDVLYTDSPAWDPSMTPTADVKLVSGIYDNAGNEIFMPGSNTYQFIGTGGAGTVNVKRIRYKSLPLPNYSTGNGVRIKKIEFLDHDVVIPTETRNYSYQLFDNNNLTSGRLYNLEGDNPIVYKNVTETVGTNKGRTQYYFKRLEDVPENVDADGNFTGDNLAHYNIQRYGLLEKREVYDAANTKVAQEENTFEYYPIGGFYLLNNYSSTTQVKNSVIRKQVNLSTSFTGSGQISTTAESTRDTKDLNIINKKTTTPDGDVVEENYTYSKASDLRLWIANVRDRIITSETKKNGVVIAKGKTLYEDTTHFYPTSQISFLPDDLSQSVKNISYDLYDDKGNPVQYTAFPEVGSTGVPTTIIYGYNKTLPIAKIEGAKFSDIPTALITAIVNASNEDADALVATEEAKELALIDALNTFKNDTALQNFMVTCYTHNPLIGITTTIPPNGIMELYKYDAYNRLQKTVDVNGNIIKEYQYNYKQ